MSKAFTREDDQDSATVRPAPVSSLPPGIKNYLTPEGAGQLRAELDRLAAVERPAVAARPADPETRRELQELDQRIRYLQQSLRSAEVVAPPTHPPEAVHFGTTVTVRESDGAETAYRIVGVDEADPAADRVSWRSPLAQALLNARPGDRIAFRAPAGPRELQIVAVR